MSAKSYGNFWIFARYKPRWTNFGLVGTSQWEASDIWQFFSYDLKKGHHSKTKAIRRNLMHADSFIFISRVAALKNHTFFNHFLRLTIKHYCKMFTYFCRMSFSYVTLHIWTHLAAWRTNANDRWKYRQDCLHFLHS